MLMDELQDLSPKLHSLVEAKVINSSQQNLRSKMDSLLRSIKSLQEKRSRLDYEIRKQKSALLKKRLELRRETRSIRSKAPTVHGSTVNESLTLLLEAPELAKIDNYLLRESARLVDD